MQSRSIYRRGLGSAFVILSIASNLMGKDDSVAAGPSASLAGRWDMILRAPEGEYPSWLEVRQSGPHTLVGSFVGRFGSARPISKVEFEKDRLSFSLPPQFESHTDDQTFEGRLEGKVLRGETTDEKGRRVSWEAHRVPRLHASLLRSGVNPSSYSMDRTWRVGSRDIPALRMAGRSRVACWSTQNLATICSRSGSSRT